MQKIFWLLSFASTFFVLSGGIEMIVESTEGDGQLSDYRLGSLSLRQQQQQQQQQEEEEEEAVGADSCWVYTHMNKAGGTTVKRLLRPFLDDHGINYGLYDSPQWKRGLDFLQNDMLKRDLKMIWGGYTEAIRPYGMFDCKWFTVFRHPVNRLVSAFLYCKNNEYNAMCGTKALHPIFTNSTEEDLATFAHHWSNFGLRQYALAYIQPDAVLTSHFATREPNHPAWYLLKRFLDGPNHPEGTRVPDAAMHVLLEPAEKLLGEQYAAIGILEEWDDSLELFDAVLGFPNFNWTREFAAFEEQNKKFSDDDYDDAEALSRLEAEVLKAAHVDANIKRFLRLDILLYEQALSVHRRQVEQYGIGKQQQQLANSDLWYLSSEGDLYESRNDRRP